MLSRLSAKEFSLGRRFDKGRIKTDREVTQRDKFATKKTRMIVSALVGSLVSLNSVLTTGSIMIILYKYRSRFKRHWARQMGRLYSTPIDRARPLRVCTARVSSKQTLMIYRTIRNPVHPILISITEALNLENEISYKYQMYLH